MTCRHSDPINNPSCSSYRTPEQQLSQAKEHVEHVKEKFGLSDTPDASNHTVEEIFEHGGYLVLKVNYPSCRRCSYEGTKVMVFKATLTQAVKWKVVDPHFRDDTPGPYEAPSPIARFPASEQGWQDALDFVTGRTR